MKTYVGHTEDLESRIKKHNNGSVPFTSKFTPWKVLYTETGLTKAEAMKREKYFKSSAGRRKLKLILQEIGYIK